MAYDGTRTAPAETPQSGAEPTAPSWEASRLAHPAGRRSDVWQSDDWRFDDWRSSVGGDWSVADCDATHLQGWPVPDRP